MTRRSWDHAKGEVRRLTVDSKVLNGNPLGDPHERAVDIYLPPGYRPWSRVPLLVDLAGFTGSGLGHTNWRAFTENVPERLDRLIASGAMGPVVVAFPDCYTRLGGNQYINSAGMGAYADFLIQEVVPQVESTFGCGGQGRRGLFGKSSGGYGAIVHGMLHAQFWSAVACHSGDMAFDLVYLHDMAATLNVLAKHGRSVEAFIRHFEGQRKPSDKETHALMILAMAATYDPDPRQFLSIRLPVDLETCEIIPERWALWTRWDPLVLAETRTAELKKLKVSIGFEL
ncbi:MAG: enterochelin esterase [Alphaproteobacteria bacterium]|nr:enterochelin esterase [Alphaproteobacteria bacterium]